MSTQPMRTILHSPSVSGRMAKWAVELSEYDIEFRNRTSAKSQVLADFIIELPPISPEADLLHDWILHVDGSSSRHGAGVGIRLESPTGEVLEQSFRLEFRASNNEAEYEALLAGLRLAKEVGAKRINAYCDSQLVANQFNGEYDTRDERMEAYLKLVHGLTKNFDAFKVTKIPRAENTQADALASLGSSSDSDFRRVIPIESIPEPSISLPKGVCSITAESDDQLEPEAPVSQNGQPAATDWRQEIIKYIASGELPSDKWAARRLKTRSAYYTVLNGELYRWNAAEALLQCLAGDEVYRVMAESHEGAGGSHSGGRALAVKIKRLGFYWPTMLRDCAEHARCCEQCQRHGPMINSPTEPLSTATAPYPFMRWAMDIMGPFPKSRQKRYIIVVTDYFTKWVEAEAYAMIRANDVQNFVWKYVICRHGLPYEIVTDNGSQFISATFEDFCAKWKIRLSKSTPRYPQGNGQAEASNKIIIDGLKKRLEEKKGLWADELDGVLWSFRTTPRQSTNRTPFSLAYGLEAMAPAEVTVNSLRRVTMTENPDLNDDMLVDNHDHIEEARDEALVRIQNYQQLAMRYYNKRVRNRSFAVGDLVLRKVYENTAEYKAGKLGANWEGPYQVTKIVRPGVYELMTLEGTMIPRSWNSMSLKRYYYNTNVLNIQKD